LAGARVTAVADPQHGKELTALGAAAVVAATADADTGQHLIAESVGGDFLAAALTKVAPGGTIVVCGNTSGSKTPIDVSDFIGHEGARLVSYFPYAHPQPPGRDLQVLVDLVATDRSHPTWDSSPTGPRSATCWTPWNSAACQARPCSRSAKWVTRPGGSCRSCLPERRTAALASMVCRSEQS
jgi:NADPH:quinone reductase-like Zn-dependent oxidoreductase